MRVYVAASWRDTRARDLVSTLEAAGHTVAFDWTVLDDDRNATVAVRMVDAASTCDALILLWPTWERAAPLGALIEAGAALGSGARVFVVDPGRDSTFWHHPRVRRVSTVDDALKLVSYAPVP